MQKNSLDIFRHNASLLNQMFTKCSTNITQISPAVVAWLVKASVFHSVNSAPSANGGSNPAWECCIDCLNSKEFVAILIARRRVLFGGYLDPRGPTFLLLTVVLHDCMLCAYEQMPQV